MTKYYFNICKNFHFNYFYTLNSIKLYLLFSFNIFLLKKIWENAQQTRIFRVWFTRRSIGIWLEWWRFESNSTTGLLLQMNPDPACVAIGTVCTNTCKKKHENETHSHTHKHISINRRRLLRIYVHTYVRTQTY